MNRDVCVVGSVSRTLNEWKAVVCTPWMLNFETSVEGLVHTKPASITLPWPSPYLLRGINAKISSYSVLFELPHRILQSQVVGLPTQVVCIIHLWLVGFTISSCFSAHIHILKSPWPIHSPWCADAVSFSSSYSVIFLFQLPHTLKTAWQ